MILKHEEIASYHLPQDATPKEKQHDLCSLHYMSYKVLDDSMSTIQVTTESGTHSHARHRTVLLWDQQVICMHL